MLTAQEKEIAIAEMLGAKEEQWYPPNVQTGDTGKYYKFDKDIAKRLGLTSLQASGDYGLKFHSDANWQYEAIEWIEKQAHQTTIVYNPYAKRYIITIEDWDMSVRRIIVQEKEYSKREAVFEALYQFSQYIKGKK